MILIWSLAFLWLKYSCFTFLCENLTNHWKRTLKSFLKISCSKWLSALTLTQTQMHIHETCHWELLSDGPKNQHIIPKHVCRFYLSAQLNLCYPKKRTQHIPHMGYNKDIDWNPAVTKALTLNAWESDLLHLVLWMDTEFLEQQKNDFFTKK